MTSVCLLLLIGFDRLSRLDKIIFGNTVHDEWKRSASHGWISGDKIFGKAWIEWDDCFELFDLLGGQGDSEGFDIVVEMLDLSTSDKL